MQLANNATNHDQFPGNHATNWDMEIRSSKAVGLLCFPVCVGRPITDYLRGDPTEQHRVGLRHTRPQRLGHTINQRGAWSAYASVWVPARLRARPDQHVSAVVTQAGK